MLFKSCKAFAIISYFYRLKKKHTPIYKYIVKKIDFRVKWVRVCYLKSCKAFAILNKKKEIILDAKK